MRFLYSLLVAAIFSTLTLWAFVMVWDFFQLGFIHHPSPNDFGIFFFVWLSTTVFAAIPAAIASHRIVLLSLEHKYRKCFIAGAATGAFSILAIALCANLNLANEYVRTVFLENLRFVPFFGLAGGIGGLVFCFSRLNLWQEQWP